MLFFLFSQISYYLFHPTMLSFLIQPTEGGLKISYILPPMSPQTCACSLDN